MNEISNKPIIIIPSIEWVENDPVSNGSGARQTGFVPLSQVLQLFKQLMQGRYSLYQSPAQSMTITRPSAQPQPVKASPQQPVSERPRLSSLLAKVNTYNEGFNGSNGDDGPSMAKDLLQALYESPGRLRETLTSISQNDQKDDAVASFVRALLESGPEGGKVLKELPQDIKEALLQYIGTGDSWSAEKDAVYLMLAKVTNPTYYDKALDGTGLTVNGQELRSTIDFNNRDTMKFIQLYEGAV